ncbi:MAG: ankyrin repeat domain-containing protein [Gemmatimonadaceae bacterium]
MTIARRDFVSPGTRAVKLGVVLCAAALLGGAARGPGGPGGRGGPGGPGGPANVPPSPTVANAAMAGDTATVRRLVAAGANVNVPQGDGMTALHWAAERGDLKMATELLKAHASVKAVTREANYTPLHIASRDGNAAVVRALLTAGADVHALTNSGATALHLAAGSGSADAVLALIEKGADVNAKESAHGQTPLVFAAEYNRADAIRVLLKHGADASIYTAEDNLREESARDQAAQKKRNEVLLSYMPQARKDSVAAAAKAEAARLAANPGLAGGRGGSRGGGGGGMRPVGPFTPEQVQAAIDSGRALAMSAAAAKGPVTEVVDTINGGVAGYAASVGGVGGLTALHHAARQGNMAAVAALLDGGANINEASLVDHTTPLLMATINGQFDVAMQLIARGADPNIESTAGATPLYTTVNTQWAPRSRFPQPQAVQNQKAGYLDVMTALLNAHADPNVRIKTHLWYFAFNNCGNANCGLENLEGTTAFWRAAYATDVDAMKLLISYGADPNIPSKKNAVAGRGGRGGRGGAAGGRGGAGGAAAPGGYAAATSAFVVGRTDVSAGPDGGAAPAARGGGGRGVIPGPGLDPAVDSAAKAAVPGIGVYPLHAASGVGFGNGFAGNSLRHAPDGWMPAVKYLVEVLHADVNIRDENGYTPLHNAAARGDNEMILYLVSKGADVKAVARNGRTTVDMANSPVSRTRPFPETIALLEKLGAHNSHNCVSCW